MNIEFLMMLKELYAQRRRIFLTILAIAWGTASIAGMLAVGEGIRVAFGRGITSGGKALIYIYPGVVSKDSVGDNLGLVRGSNIFLNKNDITNIKKNLPELSLVMGGYQFPAAISYNSKYSYSVNQAVTPDYAKFRGINVAKSGRWLSYLDNKNSRMVIVLGYEVAQNLFDKSVNPIGKQVLLGGRAFMVIGVTKPKFKFGGRLGAEDASMVWIPQQTYYALTSIRNYDFILLSDSSLLNKSVGDSVINTVKQVIAVRNGFDPQDPEALLVYNSAATQATLSWVFLGMQIFLGIIGGITLLVAGVGIANVMFISVKQNIKVIGTQMALGAKSYQILVHYLFEGLFTTFVGGVIGLLGVKLIIWLVQKIPVSGGFFAQIGKPVPILSTGVVLSVIIVLGIIGLLAAFFPALRASRVDPAVALREN